MFPHTLKPKLGSRTLFYLLEALMKFCGSSGPLIRRGIPDLFQIYLNNQYIYVLFNVNTVSIQLFGYYPV
jgi:hypothetical protein